MNSYVAIIPARGGSKGLPKKNVLNLSGKPLIAHTIDAAIKSKCFSDVIVSTDCNEIKKISLQWGAKVIDRPAELATDEASSLDVISHVLESIGCFQNTSTHFTLLQPTSPLRTLIHIQEAINQYESSAKNTLVSIVECQESPFKTLYLDSKGSVKPVRNWQDLTATRQSLPKSFKPNGAIYIANTQEFILSKSLINNDTEFYVMGKDVSIDIDTIEDLLIAERTLCE